MNEQIVNANTVNSVNSQVADIAQGARDLGNYPTYYYVDPVTGLTYPVIGSDPHVPIVISPPTIPQTPNTPTSPPTIITPPTTFDSYGIGGYPTNLDPYSKTGQSINLSLNIAPNQTTGQASDQASNQSAALNLGSGNTNNMPIWLIAGAAVLLLFGMIVLRRG